MGLKCMSKSLLATCNFQVEIIDRCTITSSSTEKPALSL